MKLVSKVTEIYCIADDFCKEYELELRKKAISCSNCSGNSPKTRNRKVFNDLTKDLFGKLYADKGYISQSLFASLFDRGVHIVTGIRGNMKNRLIDIHDKIMLRKRSIIETINDMLKNVAQIVHTRHRSLSGFIVNLLAGMTAYAFYDTKPTINVEFEWEETSNTKQLTLF